MTIAPERQTLIDPGQVALEVVCPGVPVEPAVQGWRGPPQAAVGTPAWQLPLNSVSPGPHCTLPWRDRYRILTIKVAHERLLCARGWWEEPWSPDRGGERGGNYGPCRDDRAARAPSLPASSIRVIG